MRIYIKTIMLALAMAAVQALHAQQWSDVGEQGAGTTTTYYGTIMDMARSTDIAVYGFMPYVVYHQTDGSLAVMSYNNGAWTPLPTPSSGIHSSNSRLAFDNAGNLFLAYNSGNAGYVKKTDGLTWSNVGAAGFMGTDAVQDLMIDPATNQPVLYTFASAGGIKAYRFDGTAWASIGTGAFTGTSYFSRGAISNTGTPYSLYAAGSGATTFGVKKFDGANWVNVGSTTLGYIETTRGSDIAIDGSGVPYVVDWDFISGKLSVLKFNGAAWVAVGATQITTNASQPRLSFDKAGVLHLVYRDLIVGTLTMMKYNGTAWVNVGNAPFSTNGNWPSFGFNTNNEPFVVFNDGLVTDKKPSILKLCQVSTSIISSVTPGSVCDSGSVSLTVASNGINRWYNSSGLKVGGGNTFNTPIITTSATYTVAAYDGNGCSSPRSTVVATVNAKPTITGFTDGSRCGVGAATIGATASAGSVSWYAASTGGSSLGSGTSFTTPLITTTSTYYAEANISGCISVSRTAVVATIKEVPIVGSGIGDFRCGPGTLNITATSSPGGATTSWFATSSGGSSIGDGNTFTTPSINTTTTYYAEANLNGCTSASRISVHAEVRPIPSVISSLGGEVCNEGTVSLSATTSTGAQSHWFDVPTGGASLGSSGNFTTPILATTKTYYVEANQNGCVSTPRTAVVATIKPYATLNASNVSRCDAGTITLTATSNGTVSWFAASTGGTSLGTGLTFTTPSITTTTTYFTEATLNGCVTPQRLQVQAVVVATPTKPVITQNNANVEAPVLTSNANSGNQWYKDGVMLPGATATAYTITDAGEYKVQATNSGCISPLSDAVVYLITGMEIKESNLLTVYPNPAQHELIVNTEVFDRNRDVSVAVFDITGKELFHQHATGGTELKINVASYLSGNYLIRAQQGKRTLVTRFIKLN